MVKEFKVFNTRNSRKNKLNEKPVYYLVQILKNKKIPYHFEGVRIEMKLRDYEKQTEQFKERVNFSYHVAKTLKNGEWLIVIM